MKNILVIDDSEVNLYLIQSIFEDDPDIRVDIEKNSEKALSHLRKGYPDLLVLDLMMPGIDGFQILREIKADPGINEIPIIVVSARKDNEAYKTVMDYGVQAFITKPIQLKDIEEIIRKYL